MTNSFGVNIGRVNTASYSDTSDKEGWNGWLYPFLFIVLPIIAGLMILALIACNVYEYYQRKHRFEKYRNYSEQYCPPLAVPTDKEPELNQDFIDSNGFYAESQHTYNTLYGNYVPNEEIRAPVRPLSGWVAPHNK